MDCDILIKNGSILTMDDQNSVIENGFLSICGDSISIIGSDYENERHAKKIIDANGGLILPRENKVRIHFPCREQNGCGLCFHGNHACLCRDDHEWNNHFL